MFWLHRPGSFSIVPELGEAVGLIICSYAEIKITIFRALLTTQLKEDVVIIEALARTMRESIFFFMYI